MVFSIFFQKIRSHRRLVFGAALAVFAVTAGVLIYKNSSLKFTSSTGVIGSDKSSELFRTMTVDGESYQEEYLAKKAAQKSGENKTDKNVKGVSTSVLGTADTTSYVQYLPIVGVSNYSSSQFNGTANLSIPLKTPPGMGGYSPNLSVNYSSGSVDEFMHKIDTKLMQVFHRQSSTLGLGWSMDESSIAIDTHQNNNACFWTYKIVFPGGQGEMISVDANGNPIPRCEWKKTVVGDPDSWDWVPTTKYWEWRTNPEMFLKIQQGYASTLFPADADFLSNPIWKVQTPDGSVYAFGDGSSRTERNGMVMYHNNPWWSADVPPVLHCNTQYTGWKLYKSINPFGQKIKYAYTPSSGNGTCGGVVPVAGSKITKIEYGVNSVTFNYTTPRNDVKVVNEEPDPDFGEIFSYYQPKDHYYVEATALSNITMLTNGKQFRKYNFSYYDNWQTQTDHSIYLNWSCREWRRSYPSGNGYYVLNDNIPSNHLMLKSIEEEVTPGKLLPKQIFTYQNIPYDVNYPCGTAPTTISDSKNSLYIKRAENGYGGATDYSFDPKRMSDLIYLADGSSAYDNAIANADWQNLSLKRARLKSVRTYDGLYDGLGNFSESKFDYETSVGTTVYSNSPFSTPVYDGKNIDSDFIGYPFVTIYGGKKNLAIDIKNPVTWLSKSKTHYYQMLASAGCAKKDPRSGIGFRTLGFDETGAVSDNISLYRFKNISDLNNQFPIGDESCTDIPSRPVVFNMRTESFQAKAGVTTPGIYLRANCRQAVAPIPPYCNNISITKNTYDWSFSVPGIAIPNNPETGKFGALLLSESYIRKINASNSGFNSDVKLSSGQSKFASQGYGITNSATYYLNRPVESWINNPNTPTPINTNPDMEKPDINNKIPGWSTSDSSTWGASYCANTGIMTPIATSTSLPAVSGSTLVKLTGVRSAGCTSAQYAALQFGETLPTMTANKTYRISTWVYLPSTSPDKTSAVQIIVQQMGPVYTEWANSGMNYATQKIIQGLDINRLDQWQNVIIDFTPAVSNNGLNLRIFDNRVAYFDMTTVTPVIKYKWQKMYYDGSAVLGALNATGKNLLTKTESVIWDDTASGKVIGKNEAVEFDAWGNVTKTKDGIGNITSTEYDPVYHVYQTKVTNALSQYMLTDYDYILGVPLSITDLNGKKTTFQYDGLGRLTKVYKPGDTLASLEYSYFDPGNTPLSTYGVPLAVKNIARTEKNTSDVNKMLYTFDLYDGLGKKIQNQSLVGGKIITSWSDQDDAAKSVNGMQAFSSESIVSNKTFGQLNAGQAANLPAGTKISSGFVNLAGTFSRSKDINTNNSYSRSNPETGKSLSVAPNGLYTVSETNPETRITKAMICRETGSTDEVTIKGTNFLTNLVCPGTKGGITTTTTTNFLGAVMKVTDDKGVVLTDNSAIGAYDSWGRLRKTTDADLGTNFIDTFDLNGNVTKTTNAIGTIFTTTYDNINRVTEKKVNGEVKLQIKYDLPTNCGIAFKGNICEVNSWDNYKNPIKKLLTYDEYGRIASESINFGGTLASATTFGTGSFITSFKYDNLDRVTAITYPKFPDDGLAPETVTNTYDGPYLKSVIGDKTYVASTVYDYMGRVTARGLGNGVNETFTYDANRRLGSIDATSPKAVAGTKMVSLNYSYDNATGNILAINDLANQTANHPSLSNKFCYDNFARLEKTSNILTDSNCGTPANTYGYDDLGNLKTKTEGGKNYTFATTTAFPYHGVKQINAGTASTYDGYPVNCKLS